MINLQHSNMKASTIALLGFGIIILLYYSAGVLVSISFDVMKQPELMLITQGILQLIIMLGMTILIAKSSSMNFHKIFNLRQFPQLGHIAAGLIGIVGILLFQTGYDVIQEMTVPEALKPLYETLTKLIEDVYAQFLLGDSLLQIILSISVIAIVPAFSEEFLFRGYLQNAFEYDFSPAKSIIITSLLFGIIHMNPIGFVSLTFIGLFLGVSAYASRTLWLPIIIHFTNNLIAYIVITQADMLELEQSAERLDLGSALILMFSGIAIVTAASWYMIKTKKTPDHF